MKFDIYPCHKYLLLPLIYVNHNNKLWIHRLHWSKEHLDLILHGFTIEWVPFLLKTKLHKA